MRKSSKIFVVALAAVMGASMCACTMADNGKDSEKNVESVVASGYDPSTLVKLTIDGGSQNAAYNTTASLEYDKNSNPYPYNTLERLVEEWNTAHATEYGYYFSVASSSINNDRETMVPMLQNGTAPEIIYYLGTTVAEDQGKGYFYDLSKVMETPNKYSKDGEAGSVRWRDLYNENDYGSFFSPDGQLFGVSMEKNPIGILYNKTLFKKAGITETPTTYKEFMEAQDKLNAYAQSVGRANASDDSTYICPFYSIYPWYDSYIESSILAEDMEYLDVITVDGYLDAEELVRGYMTKDEDGVRMYSPDSDKIAEVYRLIKQTTKYYPSNYGSYYAEQQYVVGNLAMLEVTGGNIRELIDQVDGEFEVGVFSYPVIETQPENEEANPYYTTFNTDNYYVRRGLSGYSTGWAITNAAMNKDTANGDSKCVDACIDILMYLSCYENNDKMVNDLGFAIPLSGNTTYEYFIPLSEAYNADCKNEKAVAWACATAASNMNKNYYDAVYLFRKTVVESAETDIKSNLKTLVQAFTTAANTLYNQNKWDRTTWPAYGVSNKDLK